MVNQTKVEDIYELSPMQQGILFHTLYDRSTPVYFEQLLCQLQGNLNPIAWKEAWERVVQRHSILRSGFYWEGVEEPLQVVYPAVELTWVEQDWQTLSESDRQSQLEDFLASDRAKGFDLEQAPLMRFALLRRTEQTWQFLWSHHHLLLDGWSMSIVLQEVSIAYEACNPQADRLKPNLQPPRPYRDYILWLQQQDRDRAKEFWQQRLQGFTAPTNLGFANSGLTQCRAISPPSPLTPLWKGGKEEYNCQISPAIADRLQSLTKQHRLTLNTIIQGTWALLLSRYTGDSEVVFGATVSGRSASLPGIESMVGLFINTLPVRIGVESSRDLLSWLQQIQTQHLEQEQYAYFPLTEIQSLSDIPQGISLFESIVVFENYPFDARKFGNAGDRGDRDNLTLSNLQGIGDTHYPLTAIVSSRQGLSIRLRYDTHRFDPDAIARLGGHLQTLLAEIAREPERPLSQFSLLTAAERQQVLVEWNDTQREYPRDLCIHQLFESQVQTAPDAIAVVDGDRQITYQALNHRANQLARYLQSLGVKPGDSVGISLERSLDLIIGFLAILKAGAAYLPLDPSYPIDRLLHMVTDAQIGVAIARQQFIEKFQSLEPQSTSVRFIGLEADRAIVDRQSTENPTVSTTAEDLAYILYTSGSTGKPKGVAVPHRGVNRLVINTNFIQFTPSDRVAQAANASFDAATLEIWGALLNGARVVIIPQEIILSPQEFAAQIDSQQITILFLTTALFNQFARQIPHAFQNISTLMVGGEAADPQAMRVVLNQNPPQRLVNGYGPTENTTFSACYRVERVPEGTTNIPIGRPIANTQIYLLDRHLHPVAIGMPGELYLGGDGLARGYLNRPDLTAEKFVPIPDTLKKSIATSPQEPNRANYLYKTGDLGRYLPDGNIEFLGRIDTQVKLRGFRIELGEIEAILNQSPDVSQVTITVREDIPGEKWLVAYLVPKQAQQELDLTELRHFLQQKLPTYTIPAAFVVLDALPLTANGKIDRRALPAPDRSQSNRIAHFVAPQTTTEREIATIWQEVLGLEQIGITDNFFELGGHSLLATQVVSRLRETYRTELPVGSLFENPTIAELAEHVVGQQLEQAELDDLEQILEEVTQLSDDEVKQQLQT
ncbi:MAG: amino acid adenylation domain-containing protein [Cyanobacteria bacterium SBLK]|nr:amino acid adenylation domain-containing protein [Cyanobacteria bacterium SBLK]